MTTRTAIAEALQRVKIAAITNKSGVVQSTTISRSDREILVATGWLREIIRGWYMLVRPDVETGDTTAWYVNFWDFVRAYLNQRFGNNYCLSAESSLDLHTENPLTPRQIIVIAKQGAGIRPLPHDTSLMIYVDPKNFPTEVGKKNDLNVMQLAYALCKVAPSYFLKQPRDAEIALRSVKSADEISKVIIRHNLKTAGNRIVGAYQALNDHDMATAIKNDLATAGILVNPNQPFEQAKALLSSVRITSPYAARIRAMWAEARDSVITHFPISPGLPNNTDEYLHQIDEIYQFDAYNSLSIEGYQVTDDLINRVKNNQWDPANDEYDNNIKNAMAAKGYYDAFQEVKNGIAKILHGDNAAILVKQHLQKWYQCLFGPSVNAGILTRESLIGYRDDRVFIRNSRHSPQAKEVVIDAMEAFFECIRNETHAGVNAVISHYFFVYIHPYMDGNGRIARFLMNALLASGGYPWTVIRVKNRNKYISILEQTHNQFDLTAFAQFVKDEMNSLY